MASIDNLVQESSVSTGSGNFTLSAVNGKQRFSTAFGTGATPDVFHYFISNRNATEYEWGTGHMSDATTLVRDTVSGSSNAGAAVVFSAGSKDILNDVPAISQTPLVTNNWLGTVNKVTVTAPATGSTLTIANGKTLTASNTLTLAGTDGSTINIGSGGTLGTAALVNTGTSAGTVPLLNSAVTWSGSAGSTSADAPSLTVAPTLSTSLVNGINLTLNEAATATSSFKPVFNRWIVNDASTAFSTSDFIKGMQIQHLVKTVGATNPGAGGRIALNVIAELDQPRTTGLNDLVGGYFHGWSFVSDGGGVGTERGSVFGGAAEGVLQGTSTNFQAVHAWEQNVGIFTGSSAKYKTLVNYANINNDAVKGSVIDAMGWYYSQSAVLVGFDYGLLFGDPGGTTGVVWPITSTGTLIGAGSGTIAKGVDLSNLTISSAAFKSPSFSVDGSGNLIANSLIVNTTTSYIGFAAAAWGSVTQATSKATAVTLNTPTGKITMNGAALASGASVTFIVNNSTVVANDVILANIQGTATGNSYHLDVVAVGGGTFTLQLHNFSAGSLSEAVVINFLVIKGKH